MDVEAYMALTDEARKALIESSDKQALVQLGADLYNAGHFWHAHEAWEEVWLEAETPARDFYQGLIQVAAAFVHVTRNEYPGSVRLLDSGIAKLARYGDGLEGVALAPFVAGARQAREALLTLGEKRVSEFDQGLIPAVVITHT